MSGPRRPLVIGVTGVAGAGKSTVTQRLAEHGAEVIDADGIGHEVLRREKVASRLKHEFGAEVVRPDGSIDRSRLGRIVFSDAAARRRLEMIVHPLMEEEFERRIDDAAKNGSALVALDAAILLEAGWGKRCDEVVVVTAARHLRESRVKSRGWSADDLARREQAQWPEAQKLSHATAVIENNGSVEECRRRVDEFVKRRLGCISPPEFETK